MPAWPTSLPAPIIASSYGMQPMDNILRTQMSRGAQKTRRISASTAAKTPTLRVEFNDLEFAIFEAWHHQQIQDGAAWFTMNLANGKGITTYNAKFAGPWQQSMGERGVFVVTFQLEVMARPLMTPAELAPYL